MQRRISAHAIRALAIPVLGLCLSACPALGPRIVFVNGVPPGPPQGIESITSRDEGVHATSIDDADVARIADATWLVSLQLVDCLDVTDVGAAEIARMTSLAVLELDGASVTDAGLSFLGDLQDLEQLLLKNLTITDRTLELVKGHDELFQLTLAGLPGLSDRGLAVAAELPGLWNLELVRCSGVTDASVPMIEKLTRLKFLTIINTSITPTCIDRLKQALPDCVITTQRYVGRR